MLAHTCVTKADSAGLLARLSSAEARARSLAQERDRSETEAAARLRALDATHQAEMRVLEGRVLELMDALEGSGGPRGSSSGTYSARGGGSGMSGGEHQSGGGQQQLPPGAASELRLRLRSLESLNSRLEEELDAQRRRADEAEAGAAEALLARTLDPGQGKRRLPAADAAAASKADRDAALER